jgi:hypothetical protein
LFSAPTVRCPAVRSYRPALTQNLRNGVQATLSAQIGHSKYRLRPERTCYEIEIISSLRPDVPTSSPTALPVRRLATGDTKEIDPALGSASSSPTMRYFCTRPSWRLKVTVLPKATVSVDVGLLMTWAVRTLAASSPYPARGLLLAAVVHSRLRSSARSRMPREPGGVEVQELSIRLP